MKKVLIAGLLGACALMPALPCLAQQQTASEAFKSVYASPSADTQANNVNTAVIEYEMAKGGFGSSTTNNNTTVGTIEETNTYNGPVSSSGATNSVNSNTFDSSITAEDSSVSLTAPTNQNSDSADQNAKAVDVTKTGQ